MPLSDKQTERYSRQLLLDGFTVKNQQTLLSSSVCIVGAGGLGSPASLYLAGAGVGHIGLIDDDIIDRSNLQRQVLYQESRCGERKVKVAAERLRALNPDIEITPHATRLTAENIDTLLEAYPILIDGSDNFETRYLLNDYAVARKKVLIHGSVLRFSGCMMVIDPASGGACYRCLFPEAPEKGVVPGCSQAGVMGAVVGVIGSLQALEAIKTVLGKGDVQVGKLLQYDGLRCRFHTTEVKKDVHCRCCGEV